MLDRSTDVFIEAAKLQLICNVSIDKNGIKAIEWYHNGNNNLDKSFGLSGAFNGTLTIGSLNKILHDGDYYCKVLLKNQQIIQSSPTKLRIFKCTFRFINFYDFSCIQHNIFLSNNRSGSFKIRQRFG